MKSIDKYILEEYPSLVKFFDKKELESFKEEIEKSSIGYHAWLLRNLWDGFRKSLHSKLTSRINNFLEK